MTSMTIAGSISAAQGTAIVTQTQSGSSQSTNVPTLGVFIGVVVGALVVILIMFFFIWRLRRASNNLELLLVEKMATNRVYSFTLFCHSMYSWNG
jgi:heme/copper-type cytochrome/quinol oxidase subunit 2